MLPTLQAIPPALCFLVPIFALVLLVALCISSQSQRSRFLPWSAIFSLAALASAAGIIGLNATTGLFSLSKAELVVQASLYAELGASVLYLTYKYSSPSPWLSPSKGIKIYTLILSVFLFCAAALGLAAPFLLAIPPVIPPLIFLVFSLSTIPILAHLIHSHLFPVGPSALPHSMLVRPFKLSTSPAAATSYTSVSISPKSKSKSRNPASSSTRLPKLNTAITVLIPSPLPSPASSSASFPSSSEQTHKPNGDRKLVGIDLHTAGSACSPALIPEPNLVKIRDSSCGIGIDADVEAEAQLPTNISSPSGLSGIREKATLLRLQARNILIVLLMAQSCALLSGALLLVLGVSDAKPSSITRRTSLLRIVETACMVLCVCGFMLAFYMHGYRLERNGTSSIRGPAAPVVRNQDIERKYEEAEAYMTRVDGGDCPAKLIKSRAGGLGVPSARLASTKKFKMFCSSHTNTVNKHQRFTSISSSFSSPRPKRTSAAILCQSTDRPDTPAEEKELEDEEIELPVLSRSRPDAQLPSPPNTPKVVEMVTHWPKETRQEEEVRVGVMCPEVRVNVVRKMEREKYPEVIADVVDTPVSEPGCLGASLGDASLNTESGDPRSPRVLFSCPVSPLIPFGSPKSPTLSIDSSKSPTLSWRSSRSATGPFVGIAASRSAWKRVERIKARLRRPLTIHSCPARSSSSDLVIEGRLSHRRSGSKTQDWHPFTSKAKMSRKDGVGKERQSDTTVGNLGGRSEMADFVDLTDPFASPTPGFALPKWVSSPSSDMGHGTTEYEGGKTALEKGTTKEKAKEQVEVNSNNNKAGTAWSHEQSAPAPGGPIVKTRTTAWGKLPVVACNKEEQYKATVAHAPASPRKTLDMRDGHKERGDARRKDADSATESRDEMGRKQNLPRHRKQPDLPMLTPSGGSPPVKPRGLKRADSPMPVMESSRPGLSSYRSNSSLKASIRSKESPSSYKPPVIKPSSPEDADVLSESRSISKRRFVVPGLPGASSESNMTPRLDGLEEVHPIARRNSGVRPTARKKRTGSPVPLKASPARRKGSPVPIPFRSSPSASPNERRGERLAGNLVQVVRETPRLWKKSFESEKRREILRKQLEKEEIELNLEEVLLAQKLLRRLDSVYDESV